MNFPRNTVWIPWLGAFCFPIKILSRKILFESAEGGRANTVLCGFLIGTIPCNLGVSWIALRKHISWNVTLGAVLEKVNLLLQLQHFFKKHLVEYSTTLLYWFLLIEISVLFWVTGCMYVFLTWKHKNCTQWPKNTSRRWMQFKSDLIWEVRGTPSRDHNLKM